MRNVHRSKKKRSKGQTGRRCESDPERSTEVFSLLMIVMSNVQWRTTIALTTPPIRLRHLAHDNIKLTASLLNLLKICRPNLTCPFNTARRSIMMAMTLCHQPPYWSPSFLPPDKTRELNTCFFRMQALCWLLSHVIDTPPTDLVELVGVGGTISWARLRSPPL